MPAATSTSRGPSRVSTLTAVPSIAAVAEQVEDRDQVAAVALEAVVGGDADLDVEVSGRGAGLAGMARARDPHPLAVLDPGGNVDLVGALRRAPAAAAALAARRLGHAPLAAAGVAAHRADHLAERRPGHLAQLAGAVAALAGADRGARLGAVAAAVLAGGDGVEADLAAGAAEHVLER